MVGQRTTVDKWRPWPLLSRDQIEQSPSFKLDMSFKQEKKLRESACKVIGEAGKTLDQGIMTIATAQAYLMRFFAIKPYQKNDSFIVAVAALFVASKTENKPKALADIAHACWRHWIDAWVKEQRKRRKDVLPGFWEQKGNEQRSQFRNPELLRRLMEAATTAERVLLYATGFQFNIHTAFNALVGCKGRLRAHPDPVVAHFFDDLHLQIVWNFVIECYRSTRLCLEFDPRTIGIACYEMTCKHLSLEIPLVEGDVWWKHIAKVEEWDDSIGDAAEVATIQDELWKVFQPSQRRQKEGITNGFHPAAADGQISPAPAPLVALAPPLIGPDTSAQPMVLGISGRPLSATTQMDEAVGRDGQSTVGSSPIGDPPLPTEEWAPPDSPDLHLARMESSTSQAKQKEGPASVHFSPSDEFAVSPRGVAQDDSAQTNEPSLLGPEAGPPDLDPGRPPLGGPAVDDDKKRARLAKLRAMMAEKRSRVDDPRGAAAEPDAKRQRSLSPPV